MSLSIHIIIIVSSKGTHSGFCPLRGKVDGWGKPRKACSEIEKNGSLCDWWWLETCAETSLPRKAIHNPFDSFLDGTGPLTMKHDSWPNPGVSGARPGRRPEPETAETRPTAGA